jgi:hypothetical protein
MIRRSAAGKPHPEPSLFPRAKRRPRDPQRLPVAPFFGFSGAWRPFPNLEGAKPAQPTTAQPQGRPLSPREKDRGHPDRPSSSQSARRTVDEIAGFVRSSRACLIPSVNIRYNSTKTVSCPKKKPALTDCRPLRFLAVTIGPSLLRGERGLPSFWHARLLRGQPRCGKNALAGGGYRDP